MIKLMLPNKLVLSSARFFHKDSLLVACCSFGKLEIRTLTPNRLKNQTNDTLKLVDCNCNHQQRFVKTAILGKLYQCNKCHSKLEQHWIKCYVSTVALLSSFWATKKSALSNAVVFHKNSLIVVW